MSVNRRTATKAGLFSLLASGLGISSTVAKDNNPNGFGATASVSVNSGNNSGNQTVTYQENQAVITSSGEVSLQQGNAAGQAVNQQGQIVERLPSTGGDGSATGQQTPECKPIQLCVGGDSQQASCSDWYIPYHCLQNYCSAGGS